MHLLVLVFLNLVSCCNSIVQVNDVNINTNIEDYVSFNDWAHVEWSWPQLLKRSESPMRISVAMSI